MANTDELRDKAGEELAYRRGAHHAAAKALSVAEKAAAAGKSGHDVAEAVGKYLDEVEKWREEPGREPPF